MSVIDATRTCSGDVNVYLLFEPITLADLRLPNRIVVAPMCQYTAKNGTMNDWHIANAGSFAEAGRD